MHFCVRPSAQNALFRHVAAPGRCGATARQAAGHYEKWPNWANALEQPPASLRGGLCQGPQISAWSLASRKAALCGPQVAQTAPFRDTSSTECAFPSRYRSQGVWGNCPPGCGVPLKIAQLGKCVRATARQPVGRLAPSSRNGDGRASDRPQLSYTSTRPLKSCELVQTTATRVRTPMGEAPFSIAR